MKKIILLAINAIIIITKASAQNIGVNLGGSIATSPLTVGPNINNIGIVQKTGTAEVGFKTSDAIGSWLTTLTNHNLNFATANGLNPAMIINTAGNVGIGLGPDLPQYKLDLGSRMRIRNVTSGGLTAGIWFDGTTLPTRSFIGTINNDYTGIWAGDGNFWNFAMNVINGNIGIGNTSPTTTLDVNGDIRIRSNTPVQGSILISNDVNGNVTWQDPILFRAEGSTDGLNTNLPASAWTKVEFGPAAYNKGLAYQPLASQFVAPVKGIYHFNTQMRFVNKRTTYGIGFAGTRNGVTLLLPYQFCSNGYLTKSNTNYNVAMANTVSFSSDIKLEAGDIIWVMAYRPAGDDIIAYPNETFFTGQLITIF